MSQAKAGDKVKVHFTGTFKDGKIFDSSTGKEPLEFIIGEKMLMPGFENAIVGMTVGEIKNVSIPSEDAYGNHQKSLIAVIEKSQIPPHIDPQVGSILTVQTGEGKPLNAAITDITDKKVTLDANHPLAGKDLVFDIELVAIA